MPLFDAHAHLNLEPLERTAAEELSSYADRGLYVNIVGVDFPSSKRALELARLSPNAFCTIGVHPNVVAEDGFD